MISQSDDLRNIWTQGTSFEFAQVPLNTLVTQPALEAEIFDFHR